MVRTAGAFALMLRRPRRPGHDRAFDLVHTMPDVYTAFDRVNALADDPRLVVAGHDPLVLERYPTMSDRVAVIA